MGDADLETLAEWRRVIERHIRGDYLTVEELCEMLRRDDERRYIRGLRIIGQSVAMGFPPHLDAL
jgi:hypothetical protein